MAPISATGSSLELQIYHKYRLWPEARNWNPTTILLHFSILEVHISIMKELNKYNHGAPYQLWGSKIIYIDQ